MQPSQENKLPEPKQVRIKIENTTSGDLVGHFWLRVEKGEWRFSKWLPNERTLGVVGKGFNFADGSQTLINALQEFSTMKLEKYNEVRQRIVRDLENIRNGTHRDRNGFRPGMTERALSRWDNTLVNFKRRLMTYYTLDDTNIIWQAGWPRTNVVLPKLPWDK